MNILEVRDLVKRFNGITAVDKASFQVPQNSVFGLIGRNGAGKTTTLRMMLNIYLPDSGEVIFNGAKIGQNFKDSVGYLPEERGLYKKMKVIEMLLFLSELKGKKGREIEKNAIEYLERFDLADRKNSKVEDLSKGNQQKIQFIGTILHDPDFLIFDEPFSGLDPIITDMLREIILEKKEKGKVIIFSTHPIVESIENFGNTTGIRVKEVNQIQELLKLLVSNNVVVKKFNADEISLHEIFVSLAGKDGNHV
jgi:ABC-2 type transport system ATP-binding protein